MITGEDLYERWRNAFPKTFEQEGNNYIAFIKSLLEGVAIRNNQVEQLAENLSISTADANTLTLWEEFLGIPSGANFANGLRIARILVRVAGYPSSVSNIMSNIKKIINTENVVLNEYGKRGDTMYNPSRPFDVCLTFTFNAIEEVLEGFDNAEAEILINTLFHAHTKVDYIWNFSSDFNIKYATSPTGGEGDYNDFLSRYQ